MSKNNLNKVSEPAVVYGSMASTDISSLIARVRSGISFSVFSYVSKIIPFSFTEWAQFLHISERSLQRYKKENKTFDTVQSEKIVEMSLLFQKGIDVFGSEIKFNSWLQHKSVSLGGNTPKSYLDSSLGIQLIKDELGRIAHGVLA